MQTLYDLYLSGNPFTAVERLCKEDSTKRTSLCGGIFSGEGENVNLYLSDLLTGELNNRYFHQEKLRSFRLIAQSDLNKEEINALEQRARFFEEASRTFSKLVQDPNAGKGPEHFW